MSTTTHYDVIVIGTGPGGGTLAYKLVPSEKWTFLLERGCYLRGLETVCETRRTRASFTRDPSGFEDGWSQRYSTSTVMVWVAVTRSWSFVAPFTVILWSPLLRPLSSPEKPF